MEKLKAFCRGGDDDVEEPQEGEEPRSEEERLRLRTMVTICMSLYIYELKVQTSNGWFNTD